MAYNQKEHLRGNIEALRIMFTKRPEEMNDADHETLRLYNGFGGLNCVLWPAAKDEDLSL